MAQMLGEEGIQDASGFELATQEMTETSWKKGWYLQTAVQISVPVLHAVATSEGIFHKKNFR